MSVRKKHKGIAAVLTALALMAVTVSALFVGLSATADDIPTASHTFGDEVTVDSAYKIETFEHLKQFVTECVANPSASAFLAGDITVDATLNSIESFKGHFDGCGFTISGLTKPLINGIGAYDDRFGLVENLVLEGSISVVLEGSISVELDIQGAVARKNYGTIKNCLSRVNLSANGQNCSELGGIAGENGGIIESCVNVGNISGTIQLGGICGYNYATVKNSCNFGTISSGYTIVGGICGEIADIGTCTVELCYNAGRVTGANYFGSICGKGSFTSCYNCSDVCEKEAVSGCTDLTIDKMTGGTALATEHMSALADTFTAYSNASDGGYLTFPLPNGLAAFSTASEGKGKIEPIKMHNFGTAADADWQVVTAISSVAELKAFSARVNAGETGLNAVLTADITFTEEDNFVGDTTNNFTAIGYGEGYGESYQTLSGVYYKGKFDGCGYIITGLKISKLTASLFQKEWYQGLFGYLDEGGLVQNVGLEGGSIKGSNHIGGVVGYNKGTVRSCYNKSEIGGTTYLGGIVGSNCGIVQNCYNTHSIDDGSYCGGIVGDNSTGKVYYCYNTGAINGNGMVGLVVGGSNPGTLKNCYYNKDNGGDNLGAFEIADSDGVLEGLTTLNMTGTNADGTDRAETKMSALFDEENSGVWVAKADVSSETDKVFYYPQLKVFADRYVEHPSAVLHNFGTDNDEKADWQIATAISSVDELNAFSARVNAGEAGLNAVLTANITFGENDWTDATKTNNFTAIGDNDNPFIGKFDGCGYKIIGLTIDSEKSSQGLFGVVGSVSSDGALVENVTLTGGSIKGDANVGGIAGMLLGTIRNCRNENTVSGKGNLIGGICGYTNIPNLKNSTVESCINTGEISGSGESSSVVGGLVGNLTGTSLSNSYNTGKVVATARRAGGIVGKVSSGSVKNCYNTGAVRSTEYVGGVVGDKIGGTISDCFYNKNICTFGGFGGYDGGVGGTDDNNNNVKGLAIGDMTGSDALSNMSGFTSADWAVYDNVTDAAGNVIAYTFPQPKYFYGKVDPVKMHNFGTDNADWQPVSVIISNVTELKAFSGRVNAGETGLNAVLMTDITFGENDWTDATKTNNFTAIGNETTAFTGKFDGCGYTITGLKIDASVDYQGLFGYVGTGGLVQNVELLGGSIKSYNWYVGGVAGYNGGIIQNCRNTSAVTGNNKTGGIVGYNEDGTIQNCNNAGAIYGTGRFVGGVAGHDTSGTIQNCCNTGTINAKNDYVGGIVGYSDKSTIQNCYSTGAVSGSEYVGGVAGYKDGGGTISNCFYNNEICSVLAINGTDDNDDNVKGLAIGAMTGSDALTSMNGFTSADWAVYENVTYEGNVIAYTFPQPKYFDGKVEPVQLYNFGTDAADWQPVSVIIYDKAGLVEFSERVNAGETELNAVLTTDIDMSGVSFTPIGNSSNKFKGKFDGRNHTISKLTTKSTGNQGLFGWVEGGLIENVTLTGGSIEGGIWVGGIAGTFTGVMRNCRNENSVTGISNVGGLCGSTNADKGRGGDSKIENCYNTGAVNGGGIQVGGLVGCLTSTDISNSFNTGNVTATSADAVLKKIGGIAGYLEKSEIDSCYNTGAVKAVNTSGKAAGSYIGGIAGQARASGNEFISYSYNSGSVTGESNLGGICGGRNEGGNVYYTGCYYNSDVCPFGVDNEAETVGVKALTTRNMTGEESSESHRIATMDLFDFDNTWETKADEAGDENGYKTVYYPKLKSFTSASNPTAQLHDFGVTEGVYDWQGFIKISSPSELNAFAERVNNGEAGLNAVLTTDIDMSGVSFTPIGNSGNKFEGKFDGCGKTISGLVINSPNGRYQGLFGYVENGIIKNLGLTGGSISGYRYVGGIAGEFRGTMLNCYNENAINGEAFIGGLCGWVDANSKIERCYNTGDINSTMGEVGGLVGRLCGSSISNSYNRGNVTVKSDLDSAAVESVGGIAGRVYNGDITDCYTMADIKVTETDGTPNGEYIGGIVGGVQAANDTTTSTTVTITNCFSVGSVTGLAHTGGVVGGKVFDSKDDLNIVNCYYNKDLCSYGALDGEDDADIGLIGLTSKDFTAENLLSFHEGIWTFGTTAAVPSAEDEYGNRTTEYYYPCLKNVGAAVNTYNTTEHNFNAQNPTEASSDDDWKAFVSISTPAELQDFSARVNNGDTGLCAVLKNDIDMDGEDFTAIGFYFDTTTGDDKQFKGCFDGCGYVIKNLTISSTENSQGLFGYSKGALIMNVGLENCNISGLNQVGAICASASQTKIFRCFATGSVTGTYNFVGGICGWEDTSTSIADCYTDCTVSGSDIVGGICGYNGSQCKLYYCVSIGTVTATDDSADRFGGVCGESFEGSLSHCYYDNTVCAAPTAVGCENSDAFPHADTATVKGLSIDEITGMALRAALETAPADGVTRTSPWTFNENVQATNIFSATSGERTATANYPRLSVFTNTSPKSSEVVFTTRKNEANSETYGDTYGFGFKLNMSIDEAAAVPVKTGTLTLSAGSETLATGSVSGDFTYDTTLKMIRGENNTISAVYSGNGLANQSTNSEFASLTVEPFALLYSVTAEKKYDGNADFNNVSLTLDENGFFNDDSVSAMANIKVNSELAGVYDSYSSISPTFAGDDSDFYTLDIATSVSLTINPTIKLNTSTGISGFETSTDGEEYTAYTDTEPVEVELGGGLYVKAIVEEGYTFTKWADEKTDNPWRITDINAATEYTPVATLKTFAVNLPTVQTGYTLAAKSGSSSPVDYNGNYTFTFALDEGYTQSTPVIKVNGDELEPTGGEYIISGIKEIKTVTVEGVNKNTYAVTLSSGDGYTLAAKTGSSTPVTHGGSFTFKLTVDTEYSQSTPTVKVDGVDVTLSADGEYTIENVTATHNVTVTGVEKNKYDVTLSSGEGYTLTAKDSTSPVTHGGSFTFKLTVDTEYSQSTPTVKVDDVDVTLSDDGEYTIENVTAIHSVTVTGVEKNKYDVTLSSGEGYTLTAKDSTSPVIHGGSFTFKLTVDTEYSQSTPTVKVDGATVTLSDGEYTITNIDKAKAVTVTGVNKNTYAVTLSSGDGYTLAAKTGSSTPVTHGENFTFKLTVDTEYSQSTPTVKVDDVDVTLSDDGEYTIENVTAIHSVTVTGVEKNKYDVTLSSGEGYTLAAKTGSSTPVTHGGSFTFKLTVDTEYSQSTPTVKVDGADVTLSADGEYTIENLTAIHSVTVTGVEKNKYDVTLSSGEGYTLAAKTGSASPVIHGGSFTFKLTVDTEYSQSTPTVKVDDVDVTLSADGEYTIENVTATHNVTVTGVNKNKYDIVWLDGDGKKLYTEPVEYGQTPAYNGTITPTKTATDQFTYTFANTWSPSIVSVVDEAAYTANFTESTNSYTVTWKNGAETLETDTDILYGTMPEYNGATPTKAADAQYTYAFKDWDKTVAEVTGDVTYSAEFDSTVNKYTVTWKNGDSVIETDTDVPYGTNPTYDGTAPTKDGGAEKTYEFGGWTPAVAAVTGDATYTATFTESTNKYTVIWKSGETVLETDTDVPFGTVPTYDGADPTKAADAQYSYAFTGWDTEIAAVTGDVTYTATFSNSTNSYTVIWKNGETVLETDSNVPYGETPQFNGTTPEKSSDAAHSYTFSGWTPEFSAVSADVTYSAVFTESTNSYTIIWKNGETVLETDTVPYGETPEYNGAAPEKAADEQFTYAFGGWNETVSAVISDAVYTAKFNAIPIEAETRTIYASASDGATITPSGAITVTLGASQTFSFGANSGYKIKDIVVNDAALPEAVESYTFENVTSDCTIAVHGEKLPQMTTIIAEAEEGAIISPSGTITAENYLTQTFTISAKAGYKVTNVIFNDKSVGAVDKYTVSAVAPSNYKILVKAERTYIPIVTTDKSAEQKLEAAKKAVSEADVKTIDGVKTKTITVTPGIAAEAVAEAFKNAAKGVKLVFSIDMKDETILKKEILNALKGNSDASLLLKMKQPDGEKYTWKIASTSIDTTAIMMDVDMGVKLAKTGVSPNEIEGLSEELSKLRNPVVNIFPLTLTHDGAFSFTPVLALDLGAESVGENAQLLYCNPETNGLDEIDDYIAIGEDHIAYFAFRHASEYLIVVTEGNIAEELPADETEPEIEEEPELEPEEETVSEPEEETESTETDAEATAEPSDGDESTDLSEAEPEAAEEAADAETDKAEENPATAAAFVIIPALAAGAIAFGLRKRKK